MTFRRATLGLLAVLMLAACAKQTGTDIAPAFSLKDLSGKTVTLAQYRGHPVFLDFWATWCAPCQASIPMVDAFYKKHKDQGVVVLGMNMDDDPSVVYPFVKHFQMDYPVLLTGDSDVPTTYRVDGVPEFFLIDKQGRVVKDYQGFGPDMPDSWEIELQHILSAPQ